MEEVYTESVKNSRKRDETFLLRWVRVVGDLVKRLEVNRLVGKGGGDIPLHEEGEPFGVRAGEGAGGVGEEVVIGEFGKGVDPLVEEGEVSTEIECALGEERRMVGDVAEGGFEQVELALLELEEPFWGNIGGEVVAKVF
jgi:hypothetical protein